METPTDSPTDFWIKLNRLPAVEDVPKDARKAIEKEMPESGLPYKIIRRSAGIGSLGQRRFVAVAKWRGGYVAREAKAMVPSACAWLSGLDNENGIIIIRLLKTQHAVTTPIKEFMANGSSGDYRQIQIPSRLEVFRNSATKSACL